MVNDGILIDVSLFFVLLSFFGGRSPHRVKESGEAMGVWGVWGNEGGEMNQAELQADDTDFRPAAPSLFYRVASSRRKKTN